MFSKIKTTVQFQVQGKDGSGKITLKLPLFKKEIAAKT